MKAVERVPDGNDYVIIDRAAGTGNLEAALIGKFDKMGMSLFLIVLYLHMSIMSIKSYQKELVIRYEISFHQQKQMSFTRMVKFLMQML